MTLQTDLVKAKKRVDTLRDRLERAKDKEAKAYFNWEKYTHEPKGREIRLSKTNISIGSAILKKRYLREKAVVGGIQKQLNVAQNRYRAYEGKYRASIG